MPTTGVFLLPLQANAVSPVPRLVAHISRLHPEEAHENFSLDHRLFVDTSSLLPNPDTKQRQYLHFLTMSRQPQRTFVGTTDPDNVSNVHVVTLPIGSQDSFFNLITSKMQPHWSHRQSLMVENGTSISLRQGEWNVSVGELRISSRATTGAGSLRGMMVELVHHDDAESFRDTYSDDERAADQVIFRGLLAALVKGTTVDMDLSKMLLRRTSDGDSENTGQSPDWDLAQIYMEILRGSK